MLPRNPRKQEIIQYRKENPDEKISVTAEKFGIAMGTLSNWMRADKTSHASDAAIKKISEHTHSLVNKVTVCEQCAYLRKKVAELEETNLQIKKTLKSVL